MTIATQTVQQLGGARSVLVRQRRDHRELDSLLQRLRDSVGEEQDEVLTRIWRLVFPHAYAEEAVLWPLIRKVLPDGDQLTLRIEREHQEINELAAALDSKRSAGADPALVARLVELLRSDVRDEEDVLLPRLQAAVDGPRLRRLGLAWELVRRTAPTRPHALVSRRPPGNVLATLPLAFLDHGRDLLDGIARSGPAPLRVTAVALSGALADAAGAIERLLPMQIGEKVDTRATRTSMQA